jgi:hypothetical protein
LGTVPPLAGSGWLFRNLNIPLSRQEGKIQHTEQEIVRTARKVRG